MLGLMITLSVSAVLGRLVVINPRRSVLILLAATCLAAPLARSDAQPLTTSETSTAAGSTTLPSYLTYSRPTQTTKLHNYLYDAFGPYPITVSAVGAGIDQFDNSPPEWNQGVGGYGKRFGSNFGIEAVSTTARYGLSEALKQDPLYYRCACNGVFPRLGHALISTLTARTGEDGHRVFSLPALVGPYAGSMTAVYAWYPNRYGAKDALRIGNYNLLEYVGANITLEFFYTSPRSLISRMHLDNRHGAPGPGSSQ